MIARAHTHASFLALLTWQHWWYFIKIKYSEQNISGHLCVTVGMWLKYKPIICIINNSFAVRYVTSQKCKYYGIFGFVPTERGRIHGHKSPFRKQFSAQAFKVYSFVSPCERHVQKQHMVTVQGALFSSAQLTAFVVLLLVIKHRCITAGAPFWIGGGLLVFGIIRYEYMYRATPNIYILVVGRYRR